MSLTDVLLRDEFDVPVAAGAVNGTLSDSGHIRKVIDANNLISISGGKLVIAPAPSGTGGDPQLWTPAITRAAGVVAIMSVQRSSDAGGILYFGFSTNNTAWHATANFFHASGLTIATREPSKDIGAYSLLSSRRFAVALRASGAFYFIESSPNMLLVWMDSALNSATNYLSINSTIAGSALYLDYWRIAGYWLPAPIVSDGFFNNGTSDGLGHAETSGLGSGGSGVAWSGTTWSVSGGKAINTPTLGSELITNGDFSLWSGDNPTGWTVGENGTTTFVTERAANQGYGGGGTGAANLYRNGGSANPTLQQNILTVGRYYSVSIDRYAITASVSIADASFNFQSAHLIGHRKTLRAGTTGLLIYSQGNPADNTIDNVSCKEIALSDLLSLHTSTTPDVFAGIDITVVSGTQVGLALNWDSSSSPTNGVIAYHDGANCKLEKCVAGTWTPVVSAAATYSANARLAVSKIGTAYRLYYNNALVGSGTISDAGIVNNTLHGRFNTYEGNTLDNYTCYASGTGGEYNSELQIVMSNERASSMAMTDSLLKVPVKILSDILSLSSSVLRTVIKAEAVQMALSSSVVRVVGKVATDILSLSSSVLRTVIKSEVVQMTLDSTAAKIAIKAFSDGIEFARTQAINYGKRIIRIIKLKGRTEAN